jgi:hypothetical protein
MRALATTPMRARSPQIPRTPRRGTTPVPRGFARAARRVLGAHPPATASFGEQWLTKRELAGHLRVTPRWIELQQHLGLPVLRLGTVNRYRISEVEAWLREQYTSPTAVGSA